MQIFPLIAKCKTPSFKISFFIQQRPSKQPSTQKNLWRSPKHSRAKKIRRGLGKSQHKNEIILMGNNCAGLKNKKESLFNLVETLNLGITFLQETKLYSKGKIKIKDFFIFETNRTQNGGGGLLCMRNFNLP